MTIMTGIALNLFTVEVVSETHVLEEIQKYQVCESRGTNTGQYTCSRSGFEDIDPTPVTIPITQILVAMYPYVTLVYVVHVAEIKKSLRQLRRRVARRWPSWLWSPHCLAAYRHTTSTSVPAAVASATQGAP